MTRVSLSLLTFVGSLAVGLLALSGAEPGAKPGTKSLFVNPPLVSPDKHDRYSLWVPDGIFTDAEYARMVFYDKASVPQANQDWASRSGLLGWFGLEMNTSANRAEPTGHPDREFPWLTGGLDRSDNGWDFKAYIPPVDQQGRPVPIQGRWERLPRINGRSTGPQGTQYHQTTDDLPSMVGRYPVGAKVVEFLMVRGPDGHSHPCEVRVMTKVKSGDLFDVANNWEFRYHRAVRDRRHLLEVVGGHPYGAQLRQHYPKNLPRETLVNPHPVPVFRAESLVDDLPAASAEVVALVHGRRFEDVTGRPWVEGAQGGVGYAARGGPFPRGYQGNHFNGTNCASCHATALKHAGDLDLFRDWYRRVRGTDGVLSLPMVDPQWISRQDTRHNNGRDLWNRKLVQAGLLKPE